MISQVIQRLFGPIAGASAADGSAPQRADGPDDGGEFAQIMDENAPLDQPSGGWQGETALPQVPTVGLDAAGVDPSQMPLSDMLAPQSGPPMGWSNASIGANDVDFVQAAIEPKLATADTTQPFSSVPEGASLSEIPAKTPNSLPNASPFSNFTPFADMGLVDPSDAGAAQTAPSRTLPQGAAPVTPAEVLANLPGQGALATSPPDPFGLAGAVVTGMPAPEADQPLAAAQILTQAPAPQNAVPMPAAAAVGGAANQAGTAGQMAANPNLMPDMAGGNGPGDATDSAPQALAPTLAPAAPSALPMPMQSAMPAPLPAIAANILRFADRGGFSTGATQPDLAGFATGTDAMDPSATDAAPSVKAAPQILPTAPLPAMQNWVTLERYLLEQRAALDAEGFVPDGDLAQTGGLGAPMSFGALAGGVGATSGPGMSGPAAPSNPVPPTLSAQLLSLAPAAQAGGVNLALNPAELGHLRFEIQHRGEGVQIVLSAERIETLDLLRRNSDQLLSDFRNAGFLGASLSFGHWGGGQGQNAPRPDDMAFAALGEVTPFAASAPPVFAPPAARPDPSRSLNLRL